MLQNETFLRFSNTVHESKCASFESRQKYPITKRWKILNLRRRPLKSSYRSSFIYVNSLLIFEVEFEVIYLDFFHNI